MIGFFSQEISLYRLPGCEAGTVTSSLLEEKPLLPIPEYPPSILHRVFATESSHHDCAYEDNDDNHGHDYRRS